MRVTIDATSLLLRSAGVKTYTYELIRALREQHGPDDVRLFPFLDLPGSYDHENSPLARFPTILRIAALHFGNVPGNPVWNLLGRGTDVFHCSNQCKNPPHNTLLTATIHDMTCWLTPQFHSQANIKADTWYADRVLKQAHGLIAVSENSRRDAIKILGIPEQRITVVHPGVAEHFFNVAQPEIERVRTKLKLTRPYVISVGTIEPRKNTDRLLAAWRALRPEVREQHELVFAGPLGWASDATKAALRGNGGVRYLGYVDESDLAGLTAGAACLAYPSLYEGFGLPVAQAMAAGVPVVTSNVSSLPELAQDAAEYVDPESVDSIRAALEKVLTTPDLRCKLGCRGKKIAQDYHWSKSAEKTWAFWDSL